MPEIETTDRFEESYLELPLEIRKKVIKAIRFLAQDSRHPSLRSKPIQGAPGIYEAWVNQNYRMTYERLSDNVLRLRVVGKHDEALRKP